MVIEWRVLPLEDRTGRMPNKAAKRVIIIAGPSCAGKTTLVKALRQGNLPGLQNQLRVSDPDGWLFCRARKMHDFTDCAGRNLVLHYDILRRMGADLPSFDADEVLGFMTRAGDITVITLWEKADVLLERCRRRQWTNLHNLRKGRFTYYLAKRRKLSEKYALFQNPDALRRLYDRWFEFCSTLPISAHHVIHSRCFDMFAIPAGQAVNIPTPSTTILRKVL